MKLSKIGALCRAVKRFIIYRTRRGEQWLSDGYAIFPLRDMPRLEPDNVFLIFDVPEEKRGKMLFDEKDELPCGLDLSEDTEDKFPLHPVPMAIGYRGAVLYPYFVGSRIIFIDKKSLDCFENGIELFERKFTDGRSYIVVKKGFFIEGALMAAEVACAELADNLSDMGEAVARQIQPEELDTSDI